jgi:hypothetical protein
VVRSLAKNEAKFLGSVFIAYVMGSLNAWGNCYIISKVFEAVHARRSSVMRVRMKSDAQQMAYRYKRHGLV